MPFGHSERRFEDSRTGGEDESGDAGLGAVPGRERVGRLDGDVGKEEEADCDQFLGAAFGGGACQPGPGEAPDDDDGPALATTGLVTPSRAASLCG
jgi:hypothetical protein